MKQMNQISGLVNEITKNALGENATPLNEDLSNIVDVGAEIEDRIGYDAFTGKLVDRIGRVVFSEREYNDDDLGIRKDNWEYGSIMEKITMEIPDAQDNPSWTLQDGDVVEQDVVVVPETRAKFYNIDNTYEIPYTITDKQLRSAFTSPVELGSFVSMIERTARKAMNIRVRQFERRAINNMIGVTINNEAMQTTPATKTGVRVVNLLYKYKQTPQGAKTGLTASNCIYDPDFLRFAISEIDMYIARLGTLNRLFNIDKMARYTPKDLLHVVFLDQLVSKERIYLQSDVFHNELVQLPYAKTIPFWQGTGDDFEFDNTSKIDIKTTDNQTISMGGILGTMFDDEAVMVNREYLNTTSHRNNHGEYTNYWMKFRCRLFNDTAEQFVVFIVA